jgi:hypothetical protein
MRLNKQSLGVWFVVAAALQPSTANADCAQSGSFAIDNRAVFPGLSIAPGGATDFGSVAVGATVDRGFTLRNTGANPIVGNASAPAPFSVVSGASYTLAPGRTQAVTVRYSPTQPGNNIAYITFTGTGTQQRQLLGSAFATPTFASIRGTVTRSDTGAPLSGMEVNAGGGPKHTDAEGKYVFDVHPGCCYSVRASDLYGRFKPQQVDQIAGATGSPTVVDFALVPQQQAPDPPPEQVPVLLVSGFGCTDPPWDTHSCNDDYCDFTCDKSTWEKVRDALSAPAPAGGWGDDFIWDPNKPEPGVNGGTGYVILGTESIDLNYLNLSDYITDKVKKFQQNADHPYYPSKINIVASSMGGLIVRRLLNSNKLTLPIMLEGADRYVEVRVDKVIMLGTPNAGTIVADAAIELPLLPEVVSFVKCGNPLLPNSVSNLTTHYVRDIFNPNHPWPTGVKLFLRAGTAVDGSNCWFFPVLSRLIQVLNSSLFSSEEFINDGVVPEPSVRGVYHRRRFTFAFPPFVVEAVPSFDATATGCDTVPLDHLRLKQDDGTVAWIVSVLKGQPVTLGSCNPSVAALTSIAQGSSSAFQHIDGTVGALSAGETVQFTFPCDASSNLKVFASTSTASVPVTLLDPSGSPVSPSDSESDPPSALYDIAAPASGSWTLVFDGSGLASGTGDYSLGAYGDSNLSLEPNTDVAFLNSEEATILCFVGVFDDLGGFSPTAGANVTAVVTAPDATDVTLALFDDGLHSDGLADDGTYAAVFTNTAQGGSYRLRYRADGTAGVLAFRRVALGTFGVSSAAARISGNLTDEAVDFDADGFADFLRVQFWVTVQEAGTYLASGLVVDETGGSSIAGSETALELPIGTSTVSVLFDCRKLAVPGTYGPFSLQNLELFERRDDQIAWVDRYREAYALATAQIEIPCPPFDGDCDGDVDLIDLAGFQRCFTGPGPATVAPCCRMFDSDPDGDVDGGDFVAFNRAFAGP